MIPEISHSQKYEILLVDENNWLNFRRGIQKIINNEINHSSYIYRSDILDESAIDCWFLSRHKKNGRTLVVVSSSVVLGFATYVPFRDFPGSVQTVEHSIYIDCEQRGGGLGAALLQSILRLATSDGKKALVGVIDAENQVSLQMHDRWEFTRIGCIKSLGYKWGNYRDAWLVQRILF